MSAKKTGTLSALALLLGLSGCAHHASTPSTPSVQIDNVMVIVQDKRDFVDDAGEPDRIERSYSRRLLARGYSILGQHRFDTLVKELNFEPSQMTAHDAQRLAERAGAIVVVVTIPDADKIWVQIVRVEPNMKAIVEGTFAKNKGSIDGAIEQSSIAVAASLPRRTRPDPHMLYNPDDVVPREALAGNWDAYARGGAYFFKFDSLQRWLDHGGQQAQDIALADNRLLSDALEGDPLPLFNDPWRVKDLAYQLLIHDRNQAIRIDENASSRDRRIDAYLKARQTLSEQANDAMDRH